MDSRVTCIFDSQLQAGLAADEIQDKGLKTDDISIVSKSKEGGDPTDSKKTDNISDGLLTGGALGGLAGVLAGAGTIAIPGLGILAAAGPITGLISGLAAGGLIGTLVDLGIPEPHSKDYEGEVKQGKVLFSMKTNKDSSEEIVGVLKNNGGQKVQVH